MNENDNAQASRRHLLKAGLGLMGAGLVAATARHAAAQDASQKLAQSAVQYQNHPNPAHAGQLCSVCVNFLAPNNCKLVQGPISPIGWCVAFAPKSAS
jgi:hypothetical protein